MSGEVDQRGKEVAWMRMTRSRENLADLAARMLAAEDPAFIEFADYFGPRFRSLFISRGLSPADAEDLAVSCVTDTALKIDKFKAKDGGNFEGWVFTVARHYVADWRRRMKLATAVIDESVAAAKPASHGQENEPNEEVVAAVREALTQLPEDDVTLIKYRNLGAEHTFAELARRVGITPEAARVRHFRALRRLKLLLEADPRLTSILCRAKEQEECYE
jgi:RNA polymerase sigma factor (sigma-70 family)